MKNIAIVFITIMLACFSGLTYAAPPEVDHSQFESVSKGMNHFYQNVAPFIQKVISNSEIYKFSMVLWSAFTIFLLAWVMFQYAFGKLTFDDLFSNVFLISITLLFMQQYDEITSILWGWSEDYATSIQIAAVGVDDELFVPRFVWNLVSSFSWSTDSLLASLNSIIADIIISAAAIVLNILAIFTTIWGMWGYSIAKIIGLMFIPTILFEPLSWLFNGWLRFFFGFLIYNIIAKAELMLVVMALSGYLSIPADQTPLHGGYHIVINSFMDVIGMLVFVVISIIGLIFTGKFASSIVSGSQTGSLRSAIITGSKALMGNS